MFHKPSFLLPVIITILTTLLVVSIAAFAWTEPTQAPPGGNVSSPINVGDTTQYKSGALGVGGVFRAYSTAIFDGNVGIGTENPLAKLDINGSIKIVDGNQAAGKVLTSDTNGVGTWQTVSSGIYLGSCSVYVGTCKCNKGEMMMLLEGGSQRDYAKNFGCFIYNQNQSTVYGRADGGGTTCYFACFK